MQGAGEGRPIAAPPSDLRDGPAAVHGPVLAAIGGGRGGAASRAGADAHAASPREVASQITVAIAQAGQPQVEIRLDPPELGRVQIRLNPTEHGLQALVLAERPETQDFLRRHAEVLRNDLTEAGYAQVSLDFAAGGEAASRDAPAEERRFGAAPELAAAPAVAREAPRRVAAAGLDIRL